MIWLLLMLAVFVFALFEYAHKLSNRVAALEKRLDDHGIYE